MLCTRVVSLVLFTWLYIMYKYDHNTHQQWRSPRQQRWWPGQQQQCRWCWQCWGPGQPCRRSWLSHTEHSSCAPHTVSIRRGRLFDSIAWGNASCNTTTNTLHADNMLSQAHHIHWSLNWGMLLYSFGTCRHECMHACRMEATRAATIIHEVRETLACTCTSFGTESVTNVSTWSMLRVCKMLNFCDKYIQQKYQSIIMKVSGGISSWQ